SGKLADDGVPRHVREKATEDVTDLRVARPLVLGGVADDGVRHRVLFVELVLLVEDADRHAAAHRHPARVRLLEAGEHAHEARLAVAVAAHDADPVAFVDAERDAVEDDRGGELEPEGFSPEKVCHGWPSLLSAGPPLATR